MVVFLALAAQAVACGRPRPEPLLFVVGPNQGGFGWALPAGGANPFRDRRQDEAARRAWVRQLVVRIREARAG